jgi:hypothetical protein
MATSIITLAFITSILAVIFQSVVPRYNRQTKKDPNQFIRIVKKFSHSEHVELIWRIIFEFGKVWSNTISWQGMEWIRQQYDRAAYAENYFLKRVATFPWIITAIVMGIVLRVAGFTAAPIWYDEMFSLLVTHQSLPEMLQSLHLNISPPGFEILLWCLVRILGWNEFSLRIISVVASIITLWLVYRITIILEFSQLQKIATITTIAILPYILVVAQQGRVYAIFEMFYLIGLYSSLRGKWLWLSIAICGMLWCHNLSFLFIPGLILISLILFPRDFKKILIATFLAFLTFLPWMNSFLYQTGIPTPWFTPLTLGGFIYSIYIAWYGWNFPESLKYYGLIWIFFLIFDGLLIMLASWLKTLLPIHTIGFYPRIIGEIPVRDNIRSSRTQSSSLHARSILLIASFLPLGLMIGSSLLYKNVIIYRTVILIIPPMVMWLVHIFVPKSPHLFHQVVWSVSLIFICGGVLNWVPTQQGGNLRAFTQFFNKNYHTGDAFFHNTALSAIVFDYYFPDKKNYLIDAQGVLGTVDLEELKIDIPRYAPEKVPAQRLWVIWTRHEELETINKDADEKVSRLVKNCPMIAILRYPQSWDNEVYLCDVKGH